VDIPGFARSTAPGHKGRLVFGTLSGKTVVCMQGRFHYYEGYSMQDIVFPIRVLKLLGIKALIITNAAGGVNTSFSVGDLMLITDHINFLGINPLIGPNAEEFGPRFCDMGKTYTPALRELAKKAASVCGLTLKEGVYIACTGPSYETPAEIRAFRTLGADAVGMSTVPEAITASHCSLPVLAISLITNMAAGVLDQTLSGEEVIEIGNKKAGELQALVKEVVHEL
jgi:purine-nucleoside phosphorylase